jgi:hypothetical protein
MKILVHPMLNVLSSIMLHSVHALKDFKAILVNTADNHNPSWNQNVPKIAIVILDLVALNSNVKIYAPN